MVGWRHNECYNEICIKLIDYIYKHGNYNYTVYTN